MNAREAAYLALLQSSQFKGFISDFLEKWKAEHNPSVKDFNLAQEIAYGTARMSLALDFLAEIFAARKKLNLKLKERLFLRMAVYQYYYMNRIPLYAIVDETLKLARNYCHETFLRFLNAILRKLGDIKPELPQGNSIIDLSIRYSYPQFFVREVTDAFGFEKGSQILEIGNTVSPVMVRYREIAKNAEHADLQDVTLEPFRIASMKIKGIIEEISQSDQFYIQNVTPPTLLGNLAKRIHKKPKNILDLCSSPGGKIIALHDLFPNAELHANDISQEKLKRLSQNFNKYSLNVNVTCQNGEDYPTDKKFDLVVLDVPCSNSGVLNKRPEARWRLSQDSLNELKKTQLALIQNAANLLSEEGRIWYMTCSILPKENEDIIEEACESFNLQVEYLETILPNFEGWDGGFACILKNEKQADSPGSLI